ncbi:galactose-6-phosphate isomerase subunit LacA [Vagococcus sp. BWB3-3]|uniref:Galactose-6-phosphate isomerase subunit LacA n=1 Tax=Vagococcus allomyrinae TaxID=2794353 RepID=A0A940SQS6_9ENTE|nr:galactose-6-phosphate isomerase subunit LacA [Vagococcus allomyrinae]MBP1040032.1 galactose-6-phosphate isomerase subunit LacA [Vagococcus allomyrinae]
MVNVYLSADQAGFRLKEAVKTALIAHHSVHDLSEQPQQDFMDSAEVLVEALTRDQKALGIAFDGYGAGSFIAATKHKDMIAAEISEERSAYMTREHNNSRIITLGQEIVGEELAKNIALEFLKADYEGGRHQIRVDMLNKML